MSRAPSVVDLPPEKVAELLESGAVRLLDVRERLEHWTEAIPGSDLAPLSSFDAERFAAEVDGVVLYCRSGSRSAAAAERLSAVAGRPVRHLAGGILAWKAAGRPTAHWGKAGRDR